MNECERRCFPNKPSPSTYSSFARNGSWQSLWGSFESGFNSSSQISRTPKWTTSQAFFHFEKKSGKKGWGISKKCMELTQASKAIPDDKSIHYESLWLMKLINGSLAERNTEQRSLIIDNHLGSWTFIRSTLNEMMVSRTMRRKRTNESTVCTRSTKKEDDMPKIILWIIKEQSTFCIIDFSSIHQEFPETWASYCHIIHTPHKAY